MKTATIYISFDGQRFDSAEACRTHEAAHVETRLVGLTIEQVRAGLSREDVELADAIEELGMRVNKTRREAGDFKRNRKAMEAEAPRSPAKVAEDRGREAFRAGDDREVPDDIEHEHQADFLVGYDYEHAASKKAAA